MKIRNKKTGEIREFDCTLINSSKLSAQNRQRLYWCGKRNPDGTYSRVEVQQPEDRGILLRDILESGVCWREKAYTLEANYANASDTSAMDGGPFPAPMAMGPIRIGTIESDAAHPEHDSRQYRVYSPDGKAVTLCGNGGGLGAKTGLYAVPVIPDGKGQFVIKAAGGKEIPVYEVRGGRITIKGKTYPIKLADGFYIIRKLTVRECMRLQTVPEWYEFPVSDIQAYKMLGNGWTVDVIAHILSYCPGITMAPLDVLSMYDGMACGYLALGNLGAHITRYRATEIDKYAVKTACHNFPGIEQLGDAFQVRESSFC